MHRERIVSYAQNREDVIIAAFFRDIQNGFYVDIGANHPEDDSVTKYFYDRGWSGINVEPNSQLFQLLEKERPRDININKGISDKPGILTMREYRGRYAGLSTFSKEMQKENRSVQEYRDIEVDVISLKQLFDDNKVERVHFLKIDVEGYEYQVLKGNDWEKYRPELICLEANHNFKDWSKILAKANYQKVFFDGLNEYFLAEESMHRRDDFSYVESIIGPPIIDVEFEDYIQSLESKLDRQRDEISSYKSEVLRLNRELIEFKKVVPLIKQLLKSLDGALRRRVEKLNTRKGEAPKQFSADLEGVTDPDAILTEVQLYDMEAYHSLAIRRDRFWYRLVFHAYDTISKFLFSTGKKAYGITRRIRR